MDETKRFEGEMAKVVEVFKREIAGIRTNRPTAALIEDIKVLYYDAQTPLKHLGSIGVTLPREIYIQIWDQGAVPLVAKAIENSAAGLQPQIDGNTVRVFLPELSAERRDEFKRHVKKIAEEFRIQIRSIRDEIMKTIERLLEASEITEDDRFREREEVQKLVDKTNAEIEKALEAKLAEIDE